MTPNLLKWLKNVRKEIGPQKRVLEIGSLNVNGSARKSFGDAKEYIGIDPVKGKDVDIVMRSWDIKKKFKKGSFDCIICCETLEHDLYFWKTIANIKWALKKGGYFIVSAPGIGQPHHHPPDYYRFFGETYWHFIMKGYEIVSAYKGYDKRGEEYPISFMTCGKKS